MTKGPINFEGKGDIGEQGKYGEQGNRYHLPSPVVCKVLISA